MARKQRLQTQLGLNPVLPRPTATPTDTFVRTNGGAQAEQLARALGQLSPSVNALGMTMFQRSAADDAVKGEQLARKLHEEGTSELKAVREGKVPAGSSPWFMESFQEQMGRTSADDWHTHLQEQIYRSEGLKTATSLEEFDAFVRQQRTEWLEKNVGTERDERFETGFGPRADAYYDEERRKFVSGLDARLRNWSNEAHYSEVKKAAMHEALKSTDPAVLGAAITELNNRAYKKALAGEDVNGNARQAMVDAALEIGGEQGHRILDALGAVKTPSGNLKDTKEGSRALAEARDALDEKTYRTDQRRLARVKVQQEETQRDLITEALTSLSADPHADLDGVLAKARAAKLTEFPTALRAQQEALADMGWRTNPTVKADYVQRILAPEVGHGMPSSEEIANEMERKQLRDRDVIELVGLMRQRESAERDGTLGDPLFQLYLKNLPGRFGVESELGPENKLRANRAQGAFVSLWLSGKRSGAFDGKTPEQMNQLFAQYSDLAVRQQRGATPEEENPAPPAVFPTVSKPNGGAPDALARPKPALEVPLSLLGDYQNNGLRMSRDLYDLFISNGVTPAEAPGILLEQIRKYDVRSDNEITGYNPEASQE